MRHRFPALFLLSAAVYSTAWAGGRLQSHCGSGEHTFFSCHLKGTNTVASICADPQRTWAQFRMGTHEKVSVRYPLQRGGSLDAFEGINNQHGAVYLVELAFRIGSRKYVVSSYRGEASVPRREVGWTEGAKVSTYQCNSSPLTDELLQFARLIPMPSK